MMMLLLIVALVANSTRLLSGIIKFVKDYFDGGVASARPGAAQTTLGYQVKATSALC